MKPVIALQGIEKSYGSGDARRQILFGLDLTIHEGEFVAIMGPSGCGKSTLLNIIGCLDSPDQGEYFLAGQDVARLSADALADIRGKFLGFVFQGFNLLPRMNLRDNIALPLRYAGWTNTRRYARAETLLNAVGLAGAGDKRPSQLSGGQQQRVAIARALANEPTVVLADEPTGNLDTATSLEVMAMFRQLHQQGRTLVLITHEPDIAAYASRLIRLKDGRVVSDYLQEPL